MSHLGLDEALEYSYSFSGRVGAHLGSLGGEEADGGDQVAGASIRGQLILQRTGRRSMAFKVRLGGCTPDRLFYDSFVIHYVADCCRTDCRKKYLLTDKFRYIGLFNYTNIYN